MNAWKFPFLENEFEEHNKRSANYQELPKAIRENQAKLPSNCAASSAAGPSGSRRISLFQRSLHAVTIHAQRMRPRDTTIRLRVSRPTSLASRLASQHKRGFLSQRRCFRARHTDSTRAERPRSIS